MLRAIAVVISIFVVVLVSVVGGGSVGSVVAGLIGGPSWVPFGFYAGIILATSISIFNFLILYG